MFFQSSEGLFITLEGGEGSGKSTMASYLEGELKKRNIPCIHVREPGATRLGERVRDILLHRGDIPVGSMSELLLFLASRAQNLEENIRPALKERKVVLCDRYNDSSMAYQSAARGLITPVVEQLCSLATVSLEPHLTLLLDVDPKVGMARTAHSKHNLDSIEQESLDFHQRVRKAYLEIAATHDKRVVRINAELPLEKFLEQGLQFLLTALSGHAFFAELLQLSKIPMKNQ